MKTKEIEKLLGITKDTLRFYEREGLIKPLRDKNGYRNYSQEDIRILKIILFYRTMEISIDDIKLLLNGEVSIQDILQYKSKQLENEIDQKRKTIDMISQTLKRKKAYFGYLSIPENHKNEISVCFKENECLIYDYYTYNKYKELLYKDIDTIKLSICTRVSSPVIRNHKIATIERYSTGLPTYFYIDLDIKINDTVYQYESLSLENMNNISTLLLKQNNVDDPLDLLSIFQVNTDIYNIHKILLSHLKDWENKFHIDNPREYEIENQVKAISTIIRKKNTKLKDMISDEKMLLIKRQIIGFIIVAIFTLFWFIFAR